MFCGWICQVESMKASVLISFGAWKWLAILACRVPLLRLPIELPEYELSILRLLLGVFVTNWFLFPLPIRGLDRGGGGPISVEENWGVWAFTPHMSQPRLLASPIQNQHFPVASTLFRLSSGVVSSRPSTSSARSIAGLNRSLSSDVMPSQWALHLQHVPSVLCSAEVSRWVPICKQSSGGHFSLGHSSGHVEIFFART